jgi:UDP-glucose 4-epimerase
MPETLLITGGAGFIGSHLAAEALAAGDRVVVLDSLVAGRRENVPDGAVFHRRDLRDPGLTELLSAEGVTVVSHHAAQANVRSSVDDPLTDAEANVLGSLKLIAACRRAGVRRILFASSGGTVYGEQQTFPGDETHSTLPLSPYGCSKLAVEQYLGAYQRLGDLEPVILRYANVYGPRQDPKGEAGIIAILAQHFLAGRRPKIFGDGSQTRDYVFVGDIARLQRAIIGRWTAGVYNVGTARETSLNEIYRAVAAGLGCESEPEHFPANPAELQRSSLDASKLFAAFGAIDWIPLERGLDLTLPYYRERFAKRA